MIASMTGFAREAGTTGRVEWAWELKTVNGRGLEVRVRVPNGLDASGEAARRRVQAALARGQCQLGLTVHRDAAPPRVRLNEALLADLLAALSRAKLPEGVRPLSVDGLLALRGVVEVEEERDGDEAELAAALEAGAERLVAAIRAARAAEGAALAEVVGGQIDAIANLVAQAESCPARRPEMVRARLAAGIAALMEAGRGLDPDRLHQEAVLLAAKADVREELDRLAAHVAAARALMREGGAVGRRLDFLAQEFGREANTLCAKANDVALSRIGLSLKVVVEQFREQVQNIE